MPVSGGRGRKLIPHKLPDEELKNYQGVMGHYHIQSNKTDPDPAFDWERVIGGAEKILNCESVPVLPPRAAASWQASRMAPVKRKSSAQ
jgi:N-acetyl-anhydromuramyl-L-alanine amidase AmpD